MEPVTEPFAFPAGFLWGAASAAHHVEGGMYNDWIPFEAVPGNVKNSDTSLVGVDHYNRYPLDFSLAAQMGHNSHRMSIEWSRVEPERGRFSSAEVDHYHAVFAELKRNGMRPMVTLHHFTNPLWVAANGAWLSRRTAEDFGRFAEFVGREFRDEVSDWIPINEPNVYAYQSYAIGLWPPKRKNPQLALRAYANLAFGHVEAYRALHAQQRHDQPFQVGCAQHLTVFDPYAGWSPFDSYLVQVGDRVFNQAFLRAVTRGVFEFALPLVGGIQCQVPDAANTLDFIGVNYYTRGLMRFPLGHITRPGSERNDLGWEIYPEGLGRVLKTADSFANLPDGRRIPIFITENGIADSKGTARCKYLVQHLQFLAGAIKAGIDVRGYLHWTLTDNFEWAEGYAPRFGLYYVDRQGDLERIPTPTVDTYRSIIEANGLTEEMLTSHGLANSA